MLTPPPVSPQLEGELPAGARVEGTALTLPAVRPEDAGVYACAATNRRGQEKAFYVLKVRGERRRMDGQAGGEGTGVAVSSARLTPGVPAEHLVPYFTQTPRSFLPLPTIKDAYKMFEIQITFRPDAADGERCGGPPALPAPPRRAGLLSPLLSPPPSVRPPFHLSPSFSSHSVLR